MISKVCSNSSQLFLKHNQGINLAKQEDIIKFICKIFKINTVVLVLG